MNPGDSGASSPFARLNRDPLLHAGLCSLVYVALLGILIGWLRHAGDGVVRSLHLPRLSLLALETGFALLVLSAAWAARGAAALFRPVPRWVRIATLVLAVAGFGMARYVAPRTYRIFYDEQIYMNIGQSMAYARSATSCDDGRAEYGEYEIVAGQFNKQPNGYPYLVSLVFRLFGVSEWAGMNLNNVLFAFSILLVFAVGYLLFDDWRAGLLAAVVHAFTPKTIVWSNTAAAEPSTMTFALVAVGAVVLHARLRTTASLLLAVTALAFGVQFRLESLFLLPLSFLLLLVMAPGELKKARTYWAGAAVFALLIPHLAQLWVVRGEPWGADSAATRFGVEFLRLTVSTNVGYLVANRYYPVLFTLLAAFSLGTRGMHSRKAVVGAWFLVTFGVFLFFYAGSFEYGNDDRFALISAAPLALLAGYGASRLVHGLSRFGANPGAAAALVAGVLFAAFTQVMPTVRAVNEEAWEAREDVDNARDFAAMVPVDSLILTHNPNMFLLWGKNAAQLYFAEADRDRMLWYLERFSGGVYFHYNYWCNVTDEHLDSLCDMIGQWFECEVLADRSLRGYRYALIRLVRPTAEYTGEPDAQQRAEPGER
jgi:hypothetical protein